MLYRTFKGTLLQNVALINLRALGTQKAKTNHKEQSINASVPGLTEKCCKVPSTPVGPSAAKDKEYKNPEYFCYHADSFAEAEVELEKYRLPAPSNKKPFQR